MKVSSDPLIVLPANDFNATMKVIIESIEKYKYQTDNVFFAYNTDETTHDNLLEYCEWLWLWCRTNIKYSPDLPLTEQIRSPSRTIYDAKTGVDCEDFAILISTVLVNNSIPHSLRVADYGSGWQHIYVVVPYEEKTIAIDPVSADFNREPAFIKKKDYRISVTKGLSGIKAAPTDPKRDYKKYGVSKVSDFQFEYGVKPSNGNRYKFIYEIQKNGLAYSTYSGSRKSNLSLLQIQDKEDLLDNIKFHLKLIEKGKRDCEESARIVREGVSVAYGRGLSSNEIREFWEGFDMNAESLFSETESLKILQQMAAESTEAPKEGAQFKAKQPKEAPKANPPKQSGKFNVNQEIERLLDSQTTFNQVQLRYLKNYSGSGGKAKDGATGEGLLYEFYTPDAIAALMWEIAVAHGYDGGNVLETSCATGVFFDTAPDMEAKFVGFEINPYSAKIAQLRHPNAKVYNDYFETAFLDPKARYRAKLKKELTWLKEYPFDLVIGNPPYGVYQNQYSPYFPELKKKGIRQIEMAFMYWSLQMLKPKGLMVYITSQNFMRTGIAYQSSKELLGQMADFVDAYRLPSVFESSQVPTDILVFRKK